MNCGHLNNQCHPKHWILTFIAFQSLFIAIKKTIKIQSISIFMIVCLDLTWVFSIFPSLKSGVLAYSTGNLTSDTCTIVHAINHKHIHINAGIEISFVLWCYFLSTSYKFERRRRKRVYIELKFCQVENTFIVIFLWDIR